MLYTSLALFEVTSSSLETTPESHDPLLPQHPKILQKQTRASAPGAKSSSCCQQRSPLLADLFLASIAGFALFTGEDTHARLAAASSAGQDANFYRDHRAISWSVFASTLRTALRAMFRRCNRMLFSIFS